LDWYFLLLPWFHYRVAAQDAVTYSQKTEEIIYTVVIGNVNIGSNRNKYV